jgi:hypothetical protein
MRKVEVKTPAVDNKKGGPVKSRKPTADKPTVDAVPKAIKEANYREPLV